MPRGPRVDHRGPKWTSGDIEQHTNRHGIQQPSKNTANTGKEGRQGPRFSILVIKKIKTFNVMYIYLYYVMTKSFKIF